MNVVTNVMLFRMLLCRIWWVEFFYISIIYFLYLSNTSYLGAVWRCYQYRNPNSGDKTFLSSSSTDSGHPYTVHSSRPSKASMCQLTWPSRVIAAKPPYLRQRCLIAYWTLKICIKIQRIFSHEPTYEMSSAKGQPFCLNRNMLRWRLEMRSYLLWFNVRGCHYQL